MAFTARELSVGFRRIFLTPWRMGDVAGPIYRILSSKVRKISCELTGFSASSGGSILIDRVQLGWIRSQTPLSAGR
jgi:hypothetical protein